MKKKDDKRKKANVVVVRGAGDLATGILLRFKRAGVPVVALEFENPSVIRRTVSLAPAVKEGEAEVEGIKGVLCKNFDEAIKAAQDGEIPILVDPDGKFVKEYVPLGLIDAIIAKKNLGTTKDMAPAVIGIGPGFTAGKDVDAVVETQRGHDLGRVIYKGSAAPNTGVPGKIGGVDKERVIHAPATGTLRAVRKIADSVKKGETLAEVITEDGKKVPVKATIDGVLRGLIAPGYPVTKGLKIADIDPRDVHDHCFSVSDKANAIAGGALEAYLNKSGMIKSCHE